METTHGRRTLVPVVYGGVVLLLLLAGLFFRGFSREVGDASVAGRYTLVPLLGSHSLRSLSLTWNGLSLHFSRATTPGLADFDTGAGTDEIVLSSGARLRLSPGSDKGGSLTISSIPSPDSLSGDALLVPFTVAGLLVDAPAGASLAWRSAGKTFLLALPSSAHVDASAGTIALAVNGSSWSASLSLAGTQAVAVRPATVRPAARAPAVQLKLPEEKALPTAAQMQAAAAHWADAAYAGWSSDRFSAANALWTMPGSTPGFSEDIGVGLLAESVARGTWKAVFPMWSDALARSQGRGDAGPLAFKTAAFIGGTPDYVRAASASAAARVTQARALLASADNALLRMDGLIPLLLDHGTPADITAARDFLWGKSASSLDEQASLGLLSDLDDLAEGFDSGITVRKALQDVVNRRVIPLLRPTDSGLFVETSSGIVDVAASLRCSALLMRAGAVLGDTRTAALGRGLVSAALALGGDNGVLPATLRLSGSKVAATGGTLAPESVYPLVPTGRSLPREIPLAQQIAAGVFLWTAADVVSADRNGTTIRLVLAYPAGVPHYFALQGLGAFSQVTMHGIPWHADPTYARYSDGWSYDAAGRVFYGKLTGRSAQEEIDIGF